MENFIILTSIGKALDKGSFSNEEFTYCGVKYEKLLLWDQFEKLISEFLKKFAKNKVSEIIFFRFTQKQRILLAE
jgi:hypothetical protein